ncbi:TGF-beta-activated kinase 1 and MAP3K7-binding protein 3-like protein [Leptotrombidium deliense]|uniref:TGF-beta-activated kinase 1 and MAP3K7-binding protein 3-like protein n=1 Tax=Leptotrombidium deliense TaxID=299467 RepID=A0A443S0L8_9ACAR|nr:TGF-beta-activated kinase 1 and MAP3K7-binding protein 3-like protein [Leptotrombidium deliense]
MPLFLPALHKLQRSKLSLLQKESKKLDEYLIELRNEVRELEEKSLPKIPELNKLREEIFQLRIECNILAKEVDLHGDHIPLGVTDDDSVYESLKKSDTVDGDNRTIENESLVLNSEIAPAISHIRNESSFYAHEKLVFQPFDNFVKNGEIGAHCLTPVIDECNENAVNVASNFQFPNAGKADDQNDDSAENQWICSECTFANHQFLNRCEMCELPRNTKAVGGNSFEASLFASSAAKNAVCNSSHSCHHSCYCHTEL